MSGKKKPVIESGAEVVETPSLADEVQSIIAELQATHATGIHQPVVRLQAVHAALLSDDAEGPQD